MERLKIVQGSFDGFGHQIEGILRLLSISLNKKADYQYNYKKNYKFEHSNYNYDELVNYISKGLQLLYNKEKQEEQEEQEKQEREYEIIVGYEYKVFDDVIKENVNYMNQIYLYDGVGFGHYLPFYFEHNSELEPSLPILREVFVKKNEYLPKPNYDNSYINVCCHIRLGDAVGQRLLDNDNIYSVIQYFQNNDKYRVSIHSDGDITHLTHKNTLLCHKNTDVLQIFSDFIHSDILIINYSSLSIAAHLIADKNQVVICPNIAGPTFFYRILDKCIKCSDFLENPENILEKVSY